ncbi:hypothetical protein [Clostridium nigeriense]|nr:hypothetical protein [Clostridium nigeriense]
MIETCLPNKSMSFRQLDDINDDTIEESELDDTDDLEREVDNECKKDILEDTSNIKS